MLKLWLDFATRLAKLRLPAGIRKGLLQGAGAEGPALELDPAKRLRFERVASMQPAFEQAYDFLQTRAASAAARGDPVASELTNPEVVYAREFGGELDRTVPVFRHLMQERWHGVERMRVVSALELLKVIPDTMPTVEPTAEVEVRFAHAALAPVTPGVKLSLHVTRLPPTVTIHDYAAEKALYTLVGVNPDVPDVERNTYATGLLWGVANLELEAGSRVFSGEGGEVFQPYTPAVPEKNLPAQRVALWVFRQNGPVQVAPQTAGEFDIRAFAEQHGLTAVGAAVWRSVWDRGVEAVRQEYGLPEGRVFYNERR